MPSRHEFSAEQNDNLIESLSMIHDVIFQNIKSRSKEIGYYQNNMIVIIILSCLVSAYFIPSSSITSFLFTSLLSSASTGIFYIIIVLYLNPPACIFVLRPFLSLEKMTKKKVVYLMLDVFIKCHHALVQEQIEDRLNIFAEVTVGVWYFKEVQRFRNS